MKLIAQVKLLPTEQQAAALLQTMQRFNEACNFISEQAWESKQFKRVDLQKLTYYEVKERFGLNAQSTIHAAYKVADAYKLDKKAKREFKPLGSISYDERILAWRLRDSTVSIWTIDGRERITFVCGERQRELLKSLDGQTDLLYRNGAFYLHQVCNYDDQGEKDVDGFLGIDLGVTNIAVDSDGEAHRAKAVNPVRFRHRRLRTKWQSKGTKSSRRRLKQLAGKERRFATWVNHNISKSIVTKAKDTAPRRQPGVALEDLTHIRERVTARKPHRAQLHSWSFFQLRSFIEYKAQKDGVKVIAVDPRNTSRTCPCCGHIDTANRPSQSKFSCVSCGFSGLADHIAAVNISRRASVTTPNISTTDIDFYQSRQG